MDGVFLHEDLKISTCTLHLLEQGHLSSLLSAQLNKLLTVSSCTSCFIPGRHSLDYEEASWHSCGTMNPLNQQHLPGDAPKCLWSPQHDCWHLHDLVVTPTTFPFQARMCSTVWLAIQRGYVICNWECAGNYSFHSSISHAWFTF